MQKGFPYMIKSQRRHKMKSPIMDAVRTIEQTTLKEYLRILLASTLQGEDALLCFNYAGERHKVLRTLEGEPTTFLLSLDAGEVFVADITQEGAENPSFFVAISDGKTADFHQFNTGQLLDLLDGTPALEEIQPLIDRMAS